MHGERMTKERKISIKEGKYNKNKNYRKNRYRSKSTDIAKKKTRINQSKKSEN
jgi:hypothetical protein